MGARIVIATAICSAAASLGWTGTATASPSVPPPSSTATFEGRSIDLRNGWDGAKACLVWRARGILECFATDAQLSQAEAQLQSAGAESATSTCTSPLNLYSGTDYSGLHLALYDRGYWQELSYYGWADLTVSFIGGACGFHLADGTWGSGYWYPGYTGPYAYASDMGSWDDTVQSVYIE